ncbi:MAG TPA: quinol:cytochrome C oxidoreductase, partial [Thermoanaerobaculia bacterium]
MTQITDLGNGTSPESRKLGPLGDRLFRAGLVVGGVGIAAAVAIAAAMDGLDRFLFAWLLNFAFFLSLALGALFMVVLHHLTRAGWSVVIRRLAEGLASTLPLLALLFVPVLLGMKHLYHWSVPALVANDPVLLAK